MKNQKFWIFHGKICMPTYGQEILTGFWASRRVKNTLKMTFLPLFGHTGSSVGKNHFWWVKWKPNLDITLGLERRQVDISNELSCTQF